MTDNEFVEMLRLIKDYSETELDQWDSFSIKTKVGEVFVNIGLELIPPGYESSYRDLTNHITS